MPIIGIVAKENETNFIKNKIAGELTQNKFELVHINKKSVGNIKNIKFDCVVICENVEKSLNESLYLNNIIDKANYIIVNSDKNHFFSKNNRNVITYGLNNNSTVTISSIKEDKIILYIQDKIKTNNKHLVEEQEFSIKIKKINTAKLYNLMVIFIILLIYGEKIVNDFQQGSRTIVH